MRRSVRDTNKDSFWTGRGNKFKVNSGCDVSLDRHKGHLWCFQGHSRPRMVVARHSEWPSASWAIFDLLVVARTVVVIQTWPHNRVRTRTEFSFRSSTRWPDAVHDILKGWFYWSDTSGTFNGTFTLSALMLPRGSRSFFHLKTIFKASCSFWSTQTSTVTPAK